MYVYWGPDPDIGEYAADAGVLMGRSHEKKGEGRREDPSTIIVYSSILCFISLNCMCISKERKTVYIFESLFYYQNTKDSIPWCVYYL